MEIAKPANIDTFEKDWAYKRAQKKVKEIKYFYVNLACYLNVIPLLVYLNLTYSPDYYWFPYSAIGWGTGLIFHGMSAFNYVPFLGSRWEERKLRELIEKDRQKKFNPNTNHYGN